MTDMPEFTPPTDPLIRNEGSYGFDRYIEILKERGPECIHNGCTSTVRFSKSLSLPGRKGQRGVMSVFHCAEHGGEAKAFIQNTAKLFASQIDGNLGASLSNN